EPSVESSGEGAIVPEVGVSVETSQALTKVKPSALAPAPPPDKEPPEMRLAFSVKHPEIVLLADAKDKATHALFLKNTLEFNLIMAEGQQKMFGYIKNLNITSAAFDLKNRAATKSQVLYLSQLALHGSAPEGECLRIDVRTSIAQVHVSPATIKTMTACLMSLAPAQVGSAVIAKDPKAGYYYTRGKITKIDQTQGYHVQYIDGQEAWNPIQQVRVLTLKRQGVKDDEIVPSSIVYVRHKGDCYYPGFIASKLSTRYTVRTYSGDNVNLSIHDTPSVILDKGSKLHVDFYDGDKHLYDVKDAMVTVLPDVDPKPKDLKLGTKVIAKFKKNAKTYFSGQIAEVDKTREDKKIYKVNFDDGDEGWASLYHIRLLPDDAIPGAAEFVLQAFSEAVSLRGGDMVAIEDMSPFVVRNEIGLGIKVHLGSGLKVDGYHPIKNIPLKQARVAFYSIVPKQLLRGTTMSAVVQIESGEGQRVITVRSPLQELGVFSQNDGTMNVTLYSPYWMVNKTGMFLEYKASDDDIAIPHADSLKDAVIFSYRGKGNIFAKKTTRVRMSGSEWSGKFSLDTVGSGGSIKIKKDDKDFEFPVSLCEAPDNSNLIWTTVKPGECIPFWPSRVPPKDLVVRLGDSTRESSRFNFEPDVSILLRMEGKVGALSVEMISKDSAAIMTFCPYYAGAAPIRIENCTDLEICYKQDRYGVTNK
ncbi:predicted protein, partial [Nematostella vectensis]